MKPEWGYSELRVGRWSESNNQYLITFCTRGRCRGLEAAELREAILNRLKLLATERWFELRTATVMPDHVHVLLRLQFRGDLAGTIRAIKGPLTPTIRRHGLVWQEGYHDHRLRIADEVGPVFRSIFLNPYRAKLLPADEVWPGYYCCEEDWLWFNVYDRTDRRDPEWMQARGIGDD